MSRTFGPINVLLVDDHEHVLWGLKKLIEGEWPRMRVAGIARTMSEAVALANERTTDVVVLDIYLGSTNSLARMSELVSRDCAIVVLTGSQDADVHRRAISSGACSVVIKDEAAETLLATIERAHESNASSRDANKFAGARERRCAPGAQPTKRTRKNAGFSKRQKES
jgi:DNA-binding NarL/FixJ family response regulator